jgi:hypothetical protein
MARVVKVKDRLNLVRDSESQAIVNTNTAEYSSYVKQKQHREALQEQTNRNAKEIASLKKDLKSIKALLVTISENLKPKS